jgi:hypothetical protein
MMNMTAAYGFAVASQPGGGCLSNGTESKGAVGSRLKQNAGNVPSLTENRRPITQGQPVMSKRLHNFPKVNRKQQSQVSNFKPEFPDANEKINFRAKS